MNSIHRLSLTLLSAIFILSSCAMGPDFKKPESETPENFRNFEAPTDTLVNLKWWELFNDPVLDTLVTAALKHNRNLLIAASRVEEARANLGFTRADIYPKLDIQASAVKGNLAGGLQLESVASNIFVAPVLSWEIDFWGKFRRANESAKAELIANEYSLRGVQISLVSEVASIYYQLLDYKQRLEISKRTLQSRNKSLNIIDQRFQKGIIPEIDLNQAQIQKEIAEAAIPASERFIAKTENALSVLIGRLPSEIKEPGQLKDQIIPPKVPTGIPSSLLTRRPDIAEAEFRFMAQNAQIGVAEAMRFPAISLTGVLGVTSNELSTLTDNGEAWSLTGTLFGPLFNFNKNTLRVEIQEERTKQSLFAYENIVLTAFQEVEDALVEVDTYKRQLESVERKLTASRNAAFLSKNRYDKGVTSYLEVLETERTLFDVELERSNLRQTLLNSYVKLYKALGGGWISQEEMEETNNPTKSE